MTFTVQQCLLSLAVSIIATGDLKFKGFLLQARRIDGSSKLPIGYFAPDSSKGTKLVCQRNTGVSV